VTDPPVDVVLGFIDCRVAEVVGGALSRWQIVADTPSARAELGLDDPPPASPPRR
jgi:hypothetical protein